MRVVESRQMGSCEAHVKLPPLYLTVCLMTPRLSWPLVLWGRLSPGLAVIDKDPTILNPNRDILRFNFNKFRGEEPGCFC